MLMLEHLYKRAKIVGEHTVYFVSWGFYALWHEKKCLKVIKKLYVCAL